MRRFVAFIFLSVIGVSRAAAADLPLPSQPNYDAYTPYTHWGGVYVGLNGGYGFGSSQWSQGLILTNIFNTDGFLLGGTIGFNYRVSAILFGVALAAEEVRIRKTRSPSPTATAPTPPSPPRGN